MGKYILSMDIGTQSIKVQLYNDQLEVLGTAVREQFVDTPQPMWMTQKASGWWSRFKDCIQEILGATKISADDIAVFGCCCHMHGAVAVRKDGSVIDDDIQLYSDKRGGYLADALAKEMTDERFHISANMPIGSWQGVKIKWIKENCPEIYEEAYKFLTGKDYINFRLTGVPCVDLSEGTGTFCIDWKTEQWSDEMIALLGIDKEKLPEIKKSYEIIGNITPEAAAETGLSTNTAVITGAGDMFSMLYASGMKQKGVAIDLTGTGGTISCYTAEPVMDRRIMNIHHVLDGWVPFGNNDAAGISFRYLRDNLCKFERDEAHAKGIDDYAYLCQIAEKIPAGSNGLYFLPYLMGERTMGTADSRACFIGLSMDKEIGHYIKAVLEGVALEFKRSLDIFEAAGTPITSVYHVGGGAKGDLWNQIKADVYERPVSVLAVEQAGIFGNAVMAAYAVGMIDDLVSGADKYLQIKKTYEPNAANFAVYREMGEVFAELHDTLQTPFHHMAEVQKKYS